MNRIRYNNFYISTKGPFLLQDGQLRPINWDLYLGKFPTFSYLNKNSPENRSKKEEIK